MLLSRICHMAKRMRYGKGYELTVIGLLTLADFDVYAPTVDDRGIDGVIRMHHDNTPRYFDLQVKGGKTWNSIVCKIRGLPQNGVLILYCDAVKEILWFRHDDAVAAFPVLNPDWGDVFLKLSDVERFKAEGRGSLSNLRDRLVSDMQS